MQNLKLIFTFSNNFIFFQYPNHDFVLIEKKKFNNLKDAICDFKTEFQDSLSFFSSNVNNSSLSYVFHSFFFFSFFFSLVPCWFQQSTLGFIDNLLPQFFSSIPSVQSRWKSQSQFFGMQSPGLHSNSVSLHDSDPFDSNRFIIFHSTTIRNMPRTNKPNKPKFTKDLSVTQIYYIIYRDIKLKLEQSCFSYCEFLGNIFS